MACVPMPPLLSFALDIYKYVQLHHSSENGNVFCSPFSIAAALAMTVAGARGVTAEEIMLALRVESDFPVHKHFSHLQAYFRKFAVGTTLHIANRIFLEKTFTPLDDFCTLLKDSYSTTTVSVDFRNNAEDARKQINSWVDEETKNKINDILPPGTLNNLSTLVLVNAIYFKGLWDRAFKQDSTKEMDFFETSENPRKVDMMFQKGKFRINRCDDLKVTSLILPYKGNNVVMAVLLPDEIDGLPSLEASLTPEKFKSLLFETETEDNVSVYLPKFKVEQATNLNAVLRNMGMVKAFTKSADLTGISARDDLQVSDVVHKAFVEVSEEGTEAAAASAVVIRMKRCMKVPGERIFKADHPFMFSIISVEPGTVLFVGSLRRA